MTSELLMFILGAVVMHTLHRLYTTFCLPIMFKHKGKWFGVFDAHGAHYVNSIHNFDYVGLASYKDVGRTSKYYKGLH